MRNLALSIDPILAMFVQDLAPSTCLILVLHLICSRTEEHMAIGEIQLQKHKKWIVKTVIVLLKMITASRITEMRDKEQDIVRTYKIRDSFSIGESSGGSGREIHAVWMIIYFCQGWQQIVVSTVEGRIPENIHCRNNWGRIPCISWQNV